MTWPSPLFPDGLESQAQGSSRTEHLGLGNQDSQGAAKLWLAIFFPVRRDFWQKLPQTSTKLSLSKLV